MRLFALVRDASHLRQIFRKAMIDKKISEEEAEQIGGGMVALLEDCAGQTPSGNFCRVIRSFAERLLVAFPELSKDAP